MQGPLDCAMWSPVKKLRCEGRSLRVLSAMLILVDYHPAVSPHELCPCKALFTNQPLDSLTDRAGNSIYKTCAAFRGISFTKLRSWTSNWPVSLIPGWSISFSPCGTETNYVAPSASPRSILRASHSLMSRMGCAPLVPTWGAIIALRWERGRRRFF